MSKQENSWLGLDNQHIIAIDERHGLAKDAREAFLAMQSDAKAQGVDIAIASSFRDFNRQLAIWQAKWMGHKPVYSLHQQLLDLSSMSELDKIHAIMTWSALPGASRHHWGSDIDVYDKQACQVANHSLELVPSEYAEGGPCWTLSKWLDQHAHEYGFYRPYAIYNNGVAPEPWHLSYRPLAERIIKKLDLSLLRETLSASDIGGKSTILANLSTLFAQYTLNGESL